MFREILEQKNARILNFSFVPVDAVTAPNTITAVVVFPADADIYKKTAEIENAIASYCGAAELADDKGSLENAVEEILYSFGLEYEIIPSTTFEI